MIIYNITTKVHISINAEWLYWQRLTHMHEMMATGFFSSNKLLRLLEQDDSEGHTYAVQYTIKSKEEYNLFMIEYDQPMQQKVQLMWGDKTISFHSVLEVIQ
jgi:hypothetical protein